jgi:hypothetical protein
MNKISPFCQSVKFRVLESPPTLSHAMQRLSSAQNGRHRWDNQFYSTLLSRTSTYLSPMERRNLLHLLLHIRKRTTCSLRVHTQNVTEKTYFVKIFCVILVNIRPLQCFVINWWVEDTSFHGHDAVW